MLKGRCYTHALHIVGQCDAWRGDAKGNSMTIPTTQDKGHELRAYFEKTFPLYRNPYASGPRRYSAIVRINTIPSGAGNARRYTTQFTRDDPTRVVDAIDLAMQYGRDIIDGKVQANAL
jgi:hypothetical protein